MTSTFPRREKFLIFMINLLLPKQRQREILATTSSQKPVPGPIEPIFATSSESSLEEKAQDCINRVHRLAVNQKPKILAQTAMDSLSALMMQHSVLRKRVIQCAGNSGALQDIDNFLKSIDGIESIRAEMDQIQSALVFLSHLNCSFDTPAVEEIEIEINKVRDATQSNPEAAKGLVFLRAEDRV